MGVNVGANKDATDRAADYVEGVRLFDDVACYLTINISSPNTPGLRDLQAPAALDDLLSRVLAARAELCWRPASRGGPSSSSSPRTSPKPTWSRSSAC